MFAAGIVEAIDVVKKGITDVGTGGPTMAPDQFGFQGFEA